MCRDHLRRSPLFSSNGEILPSPKGCRPRDTHELANLLIGQRADLHLNGDAGASELNYGKARQLPKVTRIDRQH